MTDEECDRYCTWAESKNKHFYEESDSVGKRLRSLKSYPTQVFDKEFFEMFTT